jgi:hypothetical protein
MASRSDCVNHARERRRFQVQPDAHEVVVGKRVHRVDENGGQPGPFVGSGIMDGIRRPQEMSDSSGLM